MKTPKQIYAERLEALIEAQASLKELTAKLQRLATKTMHWEWLLLPEQTNEDHIPQAFGRPSVLSALDVNDWVSYETFLAAFRLWKSAREDALTARDGVSGEEVEDLPETPFEREQRQERSNRIERRSKRLKPQRHRP